MCNLASWAVKEGGRKKKKKTPQAENWKQKETEKKKLQSTASFDCSGS